MLRGTGAALLGGGPARPRLAFAEPTRPAANPSANAGAILVAVMLRGGMDGLGLVAPADDPDYVRVRAGGGLRLGDQGGAAGLALAGGPTRQDWRLHPRAGALHELYQAGLLA